MVGDIRTVISAQATYASNNSSAYEGDMTCMVKNGGCIPGMPTNAPNYLDSVLSTITMGKSGYGRTFITGPAPTGGCTAIQSPTCVMGFTYIGTPLNVGQSGVRGFGGDHSGVLCYTPDGTTPPATIAATGQIDYATCTILQ